MPADLDDDRLGAFMKQVTTDLAGAATMSMAFLGDRLGLYRALAGAGPLDAATLAERTGCHPRLVREWCNQQAAAGYVDLVDGAYELPAEHAAIIADPDSPINLSGAPVMAAVGYFDADKLIEAFRSDGGLAWGDHHPALFEATCRMFTPAYTLMLTSTWIPSLDGVADALAAGARVADVGCGSALTTRLMAQAWPASHYSAIDFHAPSIDEARHRFAAEAPDADVEFHVADAMSYAGHYDVICFFDCLHDMGDPVGIVRYAGERLHEGGSIVLVEPFALDDPEANIRENPGAVTGYAASTIACTPNSLSQPVGRALGAMSGEAAMREVFAEAGFTRFERTHESKFNLVYQARR